MAARNQFLKDAASLHVAGSLAQFSQVGSAIALAFLLGSQGQGLFVSAIALQGFGHCLINVGVPQTAASQISANAVRERDEKVASWVAFLTKVNLLFGLWMLLVGFFLFPWLSETWLQDRDIGRWAWWLCLGPLLELPRDVIRVALQGTRRMGALGKVENAHELLRFFLVVIGALVTGEPGGAIVGSLSASALGSCTALAIYANARRDGGAPLPRAVEVLRAFWSIPLRRGLRQGWRISLFKNIHTLLLMVMPRLLIQALAGSRWVAYFHIASRLMSLPQVLATAVSRTALPAMAQMAGRRDFLGFRRLFAKATLGSGLAISAALWLGLLAAPWILDALFPFDYRDPVMRFAVVLAIGESAAAFCVGLESFFINANRLRALSVFALFGLVLALPVAWWLIEAVEVTGAAWAIVVLRGYNLLQIGYAVSVLWGPRAAQDLWPKPPDQEFISRGSRGPRIAQD